MNLFCVVLLVQSIQAAIYQKKPLKNSDLIRTILKETSSSMLSCAQLCKRRNSQLYYIDGMCTCFVSDQNGATTLDDGLYDGQGVIFQQAVIKDKPSMVYICNIKVLSIKHSSGATGKYFFINEGVLKGLKKGEFREFHFNARNSRTKVESKVVVWGFDANYPNYDAHGRFQNAKNGDFQVGDELIILDKEYCTQRLAYI